MVILLQARGELESLKRQRQELKAQRKQARTRKWKEERGKTFERFLNFNPSLGKLFVNIIVFL